MHAARHDTQAALEAADQARAYADAADARAQAAAEHASAQINQMRQQADIALAAARDQGSAERDAALAAAGQARHRADTEISRARQAEADARAENYHVPRRRRPRTRRGGRRLHRPAARPPGPR